MKSLIEVITAVTAKGCVEVQPGVYILTSEELAKELPQFSDEEQQTIEPWAYAYWIHDDAGSLELTGADTVTELLGRFELLE